MFCYVGIFDAYQYTDIRERLACGTVHRNVPNTMRWIFVQGKRAYSGYIPQLLCLLLQAGAAFSCSLFFFLRMASEKGSSSHGVDAERQFYAACAKAASVRYIYYIVQYFGAFLLPLRYGRARM